MELKKLQAKDLKEVVLVALTYRVSYKNLARIFNTTIDDVKEAFAILDFDTKALYFLNEETKLEDEINEKYAYTYAKNYFNKRNKIIRGLQTATDKEEIEKLKLELKELHRLIDDSLVNESKDKKVLNSEEKEAIAKYRLKYHLSLTSMKDIVKRDIGTIKNLENELAEGNEIYKEKLEELNNYYDNDNKNYFYNKFQRR